MKPQILDLENLTTSHFRNLVIIATLMLTFFDRLNDYKYIGIFIFINWILMAYYIINQYYVRHNAIMNNIDNEETNIYGAYLFINMTFIIIFLMLIYIFNK